ncbi:MAG: DUF371 domain-containing protein [Nanoarchaeota archaeon]
MRFHFFGHGRIRAAHATTLEITKDADVTEQGDCIIGVKADFDAMKLRNLKGPYVLILSNGKIEEKVHFTACPGFSDEKEIVIRKSEFLSERTLGIHADKAAKDVMLCFTAPDQQFTAEIVKDEETAE